jgi:putative MATE family efflux protein
LSHTVPPSPTASTLFPVLYLAGPVLMEQLLHLSVAFVDQWLAGRELETPHLAAMGWIWYILWLIPSLFGAVSIGATAVIARLVGAGARDEAVHTANQAMVAGMLLALVITFLLAVFGNSLVALAQLDPEASALAARYLAILVPVIPLMMVEHVGIASLHGAGDTVSGFLAMSALNVTNLVLGVGLVTGWGPFPRWGWDGLAVGTACGHAVGAVIVLLFLWGGRAGLRLQPSHWRPHLPTITRLLRVGIPGGVDMTSIVLCHLWFLAVINSLGTLPAAAHGLAVRIESLAYLPGSAFQVAAATLTGQCLGAGDVRRAVRSVRTALGLCLMLMGSSGLLFFTAAEPLTFFFLGAQTREAGPLAIPLLRIVAVAMPALALETVLIGALRGAGDTTWTLGVTFFGFLVIRIPLAYFLAWDEVALPGGLVLPAMGWGVRGAWYAMVADIFARSALVLFRFWQGGWSRVRV